MTIKEKVMIWLKEFGIKSILYIPITLLFWFIGWKYYAFGALCIFVYINFNVIQKLITDTYKKL